MEFSPDRNGAAGQTRTASRSRLRFAAWLVVAVLLVAQVVLLLVTPASWRLEVAYMVSGLMLVTVFLITLRIARNRAAAALQDAEPPRTATMAPSRLTQDPDAPSERIALAYELARRRVPANWIAARCALPYAFVELIIAEVADSPGAPRRRD